MKGAEKMFTDNMFLILGLLVGLIVTWNYKSTAKIENGQKSAGVFYADCTSWMTYGYCFVIYPLVVLVLLISDNYLNLYHESTKNFFCFIFNLSFSATVYYGIILIFYNKIKAKLSSRACVALWIIPFIAGYLGLFIFFTSYHRVIDETFYNFEMSESLFEILFIIWAAGFGVTILYKIIRHMIFCDWLKKDTELIKEGIIKTIWKEECEKIGLEEDVDLRLTDKLPTALSVGLFSGTRITYFPQKEYTEEEYRFICQHEIRHIQRRDTRTKFIFEFMLSMMWFNPIVWLAISKAEDEMELACDEVVVKNLDVQKRKKYAELILCSSGKVRGFTTCLSDRAKGLKYRLEEIINPHRRIDTALIVLGASIVFVLLFSVFSITYI